MSNFSVPTKLEHKPILAIRDYDLIDGYYAPDSDAQHLSIGTSQWDDDEISLKVWRHSGNRWSRQSEELPPHRAIDLVSLLGASLLYNVTGKAPSINDTGFKMDVDEIPEGRERMGTMSAFLEEHHDLIAQRLRALSSIIDELKRNGII